MFFSARTSGNRSFWKTLTPIGNFSTCLGNFFFHINYAQDSHYYSRNRLVMYSNVNYNVIYNANTLHAPFWQAQASLLRVSFDL